jgi:hypothetical protein
MGARIMRTYQIPARPDTDMADIVAGTYNPLINLLLFHRYVDLAGILE